MSGARREVRCPACGQPALFAPENPHRPFCSERCRQHDLGAWASEGYRIGQGNGPDTEDPGGPAPAEH
jgi:uncharacterized protein